MLHICEHVFFVEAKRNVKTKSYHSSRQRLYFPINVLKYLIAEVDPEQSKAFVMQTNRIQLCILCMYLFNSSEFFIRPGDFTNDIIVISTSSFQINRAAWDCPVQ